MELIVISNSTKISNESEVIEELFKSGMKTIHIRKPEYSDHELADYIDQIPQKFHDRIVLHSHFYLAKKYGLKGVHFNSKSTENRAEVIYPEFQKSASCHSFEEIMQTEQFDFQYVFLSPIFNSISKVGYASNFESNELQSFLQKPRKSNVYALGGIKASNVESCRKLGFDGIAVLGAIWHSEKPIDSFKEILSSVN